VTLQEVVVTRVLLRAQVEEGQNARGFRPPS
jgi:hypothetical protein